MRSTHTIEDGDKIIHLPGGGMADTTTLCGMHFFGPDHHYSTRLVTCEGCEDLADKIRLAFESGEIKQ